MALGIPSLTRRGVYRICPMCGEEGMLLFMGGFSGALYQCSNCHYVGPLIIEGEEDPSTRKGSQEYSVSLSKVHSTLNRVGLLFGAVFMGIGLVVGFSPLPLSGGSSVGAYGLGLFTLGAMLVIASGLFWLAERPGSHETGS